MPVFNGHPNGDPCLWRLEWRTQAACPKKSKSTESSLQTPDKKFPDGSGYYPSASSATGVVARGFECKLTDASTGAKYDLNPLGSSLEFSDAASGYNFSLKICEGANPGSGFYAGNASCFSGVGKYCEKQSQKSGGKYICFQITSNAIERKILSARVKSNPPRELS
jgi:hypothetical protein